MNKKRMLSLVLSFALVFTTVFAGAGSVFAGTGKAGIEKTAEFTQSVLRTKSSGEYEEAAITAKTMLYSTTEAPSYKTYYTKEDNWTIVPVKVKNTGLLYVDAKTSEANGSAYVDVYLCDSYSVEGNTINYNYFDWMYMAAGENENGSNGIPVSKGKTYYILIHNDGYNGEETATSVRAKVFTTGQRTLSQGTSKWTIVSGENQKGEYGKATWFKIKPKTTGLMTINIKEYGASSSYGSVQLFNKNKKSLSEKVWHSQSDNKAKFGVKKNTTYYLKVTDCYGYSDYNQKYGIKYSVKKYTDRSIGKKSKAKKLVRKADATAALFVASTSTSTDWYKFKVTSKRATRININAADIKSGKLTVTFYKGSKKIDDPLTVYAGNKGPVDITYGTTYGKANSGWYYVKVVKSKNASGKYSIRYVK